MLQLKNVTKVYDSAMSPVQALRGVSIEFRESEFVSILGPSGCGKTTLLNIIGGLDRYTDGDLIINGKSTKDFHDRDWDTYRNTASALYSRATILSRTRPCWQTWSWR